ncbi:MAG TPA: DNA-processing protein DprA, partial [Chroococcales cyanobacterium]
MSQRHYGLDHWNDEELGYWLAYSQLSGAGLGVARARTLLESFGSMKNVWTASRKELFDRRLFSGEIIDAFLKTRENLDPEKLLAALRKAEVAAYPLYHPFYPECLRHIFDPPIVLYAKGDLSPDDFRHAVAVVGTRNPTAYGQKLAKEISSGLAAAGVTVVSGMAVGIDSLAHWGAINSGGKTIAVLATGPDICYPSSNKPLHKRLLESKQGAVVSEFFPGTKAEKWHFPARNRIISGLTEATTVIEAGEGSGAIITAKIAFDQGRDVYAIPGRTDQPMSVGCNRL